MTRFTLSLSLCALALVAACSKQEPAATSSPAAPAAPTTAPTPAPAPAATPTTAAAPADNGVGKSVYGKVCAMCHAAGVAGAPKPGDKADWGPRIAQGNEVLYKHALEGFTGSKGQMPARGASTTLKDEEVKAAVDFMVSQAR